MNKSIVLVICIMSLLTSCDPNSNVLSEKEINEGWELLFDGKTIENWKMFNGDEVTGWTIEDDCLVALGQGGDIGGDIITRAQYENFEISVDWKASSGGNSGIMYHVIEAPQFEAPYFTGPEYQFIDEAGYEGQLEEWQKTGANYAMHLPDLSKKQVNSAGKWNNSRLVFDNGHVEHWLNGQKLLEFEAWTPEWFKMRDSGKWENMPEYGLSPLGHICLQDHGNKFWFKNIKIKQLPKKEKPLVNLFNGVDLTNWRIFGTELWWAENGIMICESGPDRQYGYLGTERYYKDFDLSLEFKQESDGNSGVFIRSLLNGTRISGWQVEVAPPFHDTGGIYESKSNGRGWLIQIPDEMETILKENEWNSMRILVLGDEVTTWLNDTQMVKYQDKAIGEGLGRIALQIHSGGPVKLYWRNIKLQEL